MLYRRIFPVFPLLLLLPHCAGNFTEEETQSSELAMMGSKDEPTLSPEEAWFQARQEMSEELIATGEALLRKAETLKDLSSGAIGVESLTCSRESLDSIQAIKSCIAIMHVQGREMILIGKYLRSSEFVPDELKEAIKWLVERNQIKMKIGSELQNKSNGELYTTSRERNKQKPPTNEEYFRFVKTSVERQIVKSLTNQVNLFKEMVGKLLLHYKAALEPSSKTNKAPLLLENSSPQKSILEELSNESSPPSMLPLEEKKGEETLDEPQEDMSIPLEPELPITAPTPLEPSKQPSPLFFHDQQVGVPELPILNEDESQNKIQIRENNEQNQNKIQISVPELPILNEDESQTEDGGPPLFINESTEIPQTTGKQKNPFSKHHRKYQLEKKISRSNQQASTTKGKKQTNEQTLNNSVFSCSPSMEKDYQSIRQQIAQQEHGVTYLALKSFLSALQDATEKLPLEKRIKVQEVQLGIKVYFGNKCVVLHRPHGKNGVWPKNDLALVHDHLDRLDITVEAFSSK